MKIIKPRDEDQLPTFDGPSVFLAGSIDNGEAERWQDVVQDAMSDMAGTIYNPRRDDWLPNLRQDIEEPEFNYQVNWELDSIAKADFVFFYFSPDGPAPITLMELGAAGRKSCIVVCPEGYWRRGNVQILCARRGVTVYSTLEAGITVLRNCVTPTA